MKALVLVLLLATAGCAAKAAGRTVEEVVSPAPGMRCFVARNSSGEVAGLSCVKE